MIKKTSSSIPSNPDLRIIVRLLMKYRSSADHQMNDRHLSDRAVNYGGIENRQNLIIPIDRLRVFVSSEHHQRSIYEGLINSVHQSYHQPIISIYVCVRLWVDSR